MGTFFKKNGKSILLALSLILNALGGTGVIPPVVGKVGTAVINAVGNSQ